MSTQRYTVPQRSNIRSSSTNELDPFMYGEVDSYLVDNLDDFNVPFNFTEEFTENDRILVPMSPMDIEPLSPMKIQTSAPKQVSTNQAQNLIDTFTGTMDTILNNIGITSPDTSPQFTRLSPRGQSPVRQSPRRQSPVRQSQRDRSPVRTGRRQLPMKSPRTTPRQPFEVQTPVDQSRIVAINIPERNACIFATLDSKDCPQLSPVQTTRSQSPKTPVQKTRPQSPVRQSPRRQSPRMRTPRGTTTVPILSERPQTVPVLQTPRGTTTVPRDTRRPSTQTRRRRPQSPVRQSQKTTDSMRTPVQTTRSQSPVRQSPRDQSPVRQSPRSQVRQSPRTPVQTTRPQSPVRQSPRSQVRNTDPRRTPMKSRNTGFTPLPSVDTVFEPERTDLLDSELDAMFFNSVDQFLSNIPENSIIEQDNNVMYLSPETPVPASPTFSDLVSSGPIVVSSRDGEINIRRLDNEFLDQIQDNLDDISRELLSSIRLDNNIRRLDNEFLTQIQAQIQDNLDDISRQLRSSIRLDNNQNNLWDNILTAINNVFNNPILGRRDNA